MGSLAIVAAVATLCALAFATFDVRMRRQRKQGQAEARVRALVETQESLGARPAEPQSPQGQGAALSRQRLPFSRRASYRRTASILERAGVRLTPGEFLTLRVVAGLIGFLIGSLFLGWGLTGWFAGALAGMVAFALPRLIVGWRVKQRLARLEIQFIDMLALLASSVRSGFSLLQGFETASRRLEPPLADDLMRVLSEIRLGRPIEETLREWTERVESRDLRLIVTAILVQRTSGGNLAEVLENLAQTMRERVELRAQVRSLTAHPRLTARAVSIYSVGIAALLTLMQPDVWLLLWTEPIGYAFLAVSLVFNVTAFFVMRQITQVEF